MENKAIEVLDKQIADIQQKINQAKVNIADIVIRTMDIDVRNIKCPKDMLPYIEDVDKMPQYLKEVKTNEKILTTLTQFRNDINNVCSTTITL